MSDLDIASCLAVFSIVFIWGVSTILKKLQPKKEKGFPLCLEHGVVAVKVPLGKDRLSDEIEWQLSKLGLPAEKVVTRYVCPKGCSHIWYLPRLGGMDRGILRSRKQ